MRFRKNIIDKKFQLKTTFRIIGIIIIAFILIIAVTGVISTDSNRQITAAISDLNRSITKDKRTIDLLIARTGSRTDPSLSNANERIIEDHLETIALMHVNIQHLKTILRQNRIIVTVLILAGVLLGLGLFFYLIRLTNRISGPIYVLKQHMDDVMNGRRPDLRSIRKNDELQEFYRQFIAFIRNDSEKK